MRAGRISLSHAAAGASNPSSCSITAGMASGPSMRASAGTRCQSNRKRKKSRAATGSIFGSGSAFRCVTMDARQQPAFAPLVCFSSGREPALKCKSFGLQGGERGGDRRRRKIKQTCQLRFCNRPSTLKPSAEDFDERVIGRPIALGIGVWGGYRRLKRGLRPNGQELRQALAGTSDSGPASNRVARLD